MKVSLIALTTFLLATTAVQALEKPIAGKADRRMRTVVYSPNQVTALVGRVGQIMSIEIAPDESFVAFQGSDNFKGHIEHQYNGNFLTLWFKSCLIPEPAFAYAQKGGEVRRYTFELQTEPAVCDVPKAPPSDRVADNKIPGVTDAVLSPPPPPCRGNLKHLDCDALTENKDVVFGIKYSYPDDERAKRRALEKKEAASRASRQAEDTLVQAVNLPSWGAPYTGAKNKQYMFRGPPSLKPTHAWDDGFRTLFEFPGQTRIPTILRLNPDGSKATADQTVHGNIVSAMGIAERWWLVDGDTIAELVNAGYNPIGASPGTGTASERVKLDIRGESTQ